MSTTSSDAWKYKGLLPLEDRLKVKVKGTIYVSSKSGWGAGLASDRILFSKELPADPTVFCPGQKFLNIFNSNGFGGDYNVKSAAYMFPENAPAFHTVFCEGSDAMDQVFTEASIMEENGLRFIHKPTGREVDFETATKIMKAYDPNKPEWRFPDQKRVSPFEGSPSKASKPSE
jgi:hypothetical protein